MTIADEELEEQDAGCIDTEPEHVDELNGDVNVQITDNDTRNIEERQMIKDILEIMRSGQVWNGVGSKRVDRKVLAEWTKKVNRLVSEIQTTTNITDTNKLINATAIYIARQVGLKMGGCEGKRKQRTSVEKENQRLLQSYGGTSTSWKDLNKGNLKGRKSTPSWRGSITSNRKEKRLELKNLSKDCRLTL